MTKRNASRKRKLQAVTDAEIDEVLDELRAAGRQPALSLHDLFDQQTREILDSAELDEEQKQSILVAMQCPCSAAARGTFSLKLKPRRRFPRAAAKAHAPQGFGCSWIDRERRGIDDNRIELRGRLDRDVALPHIALHRLDRARERIAVTASPA